MGSLKITKTTNKEESTIKIDNLENELLFTYYTSEKNRSNIKVVPFSNPDIAKYLPDYKNVYERYKKVVQTYDEDIYVVPVFEQQ